MKSPWASEVELIDFLNWKGLWPLRICGPLFSLIFVSVAATALFIYILEHCSPKISLQRVRTENKDAWVWNLQNRYTGCPGAIFWSSPPCSVSCLLWTTFRCPLFIERINFAQILSKPPFSVCKEWLLWTLVMSHFHQNLPAS